jgi:hypothetical protein
MMLSRRSVSAQLRRWGEDLMEAAEGRPPRHAVASAVFPLAAAVGVLMCADEAAELEGAVERLRSLAAGLEERLCIAEADADRLWDAWSGDAISVSFPEVSDQHGRAVEARR